MKDDLQGFGISSHDDELGDTTVEGLGGFVGTLPELLVVTGLLDEVEDAVGEGRVSKRGCLFVGLKMFAEAIRFAQQLPSKTGPSHTSFGWEVKEDK